MAATFDDGHLEIPAGVIEPVKRVLVIGAGIAGLTVANALAHVGVDYVVLEARDRLGGRLHTADLAGSAVDLGGSWIHHPVGNPVRDFARQVGIECRPGNPTPTLAGFDCATGRWLSSADLETGLTAELQGYHDALGTLRPQLGPGASAAAGIEAYLATRGLAGDALRRARQGLRASVEADAAGPAEDQSLTWLWTQTESGGDYFGDLPEGGYASVIHALASGLHIRRDWPVEHVELADDGVTVTSTSTSGQTEIGTHLVVTVPLGVLKKNQPTFSPALPSERTDAVRRLGFGRYEKVALKFEEPFWRTAGWSHLVLFPADPAEPATYVYDLDAFSGVPVLVCHTLHSATSHLTGESTAARWVMSMVTAALGTPCPDPVAVAATDWAADPYAAGAYAHVPPGAANADLDLLGEPLSGRLLFAGEHTTSARVGYSDGAMTSGIREAKRLLGTPTVILGRISPNAPPS
jgi:polyamine oxidase